MKLDKLFADATGIAQAESGRAKQRAVTDMFLADGHDIRLATVKKWWERSSIPTPWLMRLCKSAAQRGTVIDLSQYT